MMLEQGKETCEDREVFFEKKHREYQEWLQKDLVVDTRETWRQWMQRQVDFKEAKLIPREELPEEFHPHRSFYGKMMNIVNGIDPSPPEQRRDSRLSTDPNQDGR